MRRGKKQQHPREECPHCGETFRAGAPACPHCGSDADTGWADPEEIAYQSVEIPDYLTADPPASPRSTMRVWLWVVGVVLAALALAVVNRLFY